MHYEMIIWLVRWGSGPSQILCSMRNCTVHAIGTPIYASALLSLDLGWKVMECTWMLRQTCCGRKRRYSSVSNEQLQISFVMDFSNSIGHVKLKSEIIIKGLQMLRTILPFVVSCTISLSPEQAVHSLHALYTSTFLGIPSLLIPFGFDLIHR